MKLFMILLAKLFPVRIPAALVPVEIENSLEFHYRLRRTQDIAVRSSIGART
jgi:hypothetical protein